LAIYFPLSGRFRDLHPLEYVRAGRTKKYPIAFTQLSGIFICSVSFSKSILFLVKEEFEV
ncbi:hypothetical protein, partial [Bacteroides thetaiotaomicron]|uniref:hypothetical protein n=1 Tax=Bacteroides thetaiotaomicron TaxID=818 RepID=UPI001E3F7946